MSRTTQSRRDPLLPVDPGLTNSLSQQSQPAQVYTSVDISKLTGRWPALLALLCAFTYLFFGVVVFHLIMDLTWASALYFAVTTSLTVGYGDIDAWASLSRNASGSDHEHKYVPNDGAIIFTTLYIVGGMVVMGTSLGLLLQAVLDAPSSAANSSFRARYPLVVSGLINVLVVACGAIFLMATQHVDVVRGVYWAVVTISTVGYGSGHPTTDAGRAFTALFMLIGVSAMGKFVGDLAERPLRAHRRRLENKVINQYGASLDEGELWELAGSEQFKTLDLRRSDGAGVSRDAFCLMMLVRTERLEADELKRCQAAFDALDADGSGTLDMADVTARAAGGAAMS